MNNEIESKKVYRGMAIYQLCKKMFPVCRSITGEGVRKTLSMINDYIEDTGYKLNIVEVPTGTKVFDWTVPKEWIIREAYIENERYERVIDFKENNLHVMGYSAPIDKWVELSELSEYVYTQQDEPDWIPYITSYYKEQSGFCMSEAQKKLLKPGKYHLYCDSELVDGSLTYADVLIPGRVKKEILINTYICHPSMANNECSGPSLASELIRYVAGIKDRYYSYRFVFTPETIGSVTYICMNYDNIRENIEIGFNLSCCGDSRGYYMINTPLGDTLADRVMENILRHRGADYNQYAFTSSGSEERRYNAPGVDIPMVGFGRTKYDAYPEYHTSADDMTLVSEEGFQGSFDVMSEVIQALENNHIFRTTTICEPQLGKRGLYPSVSHKGMYDEIMPMMDLLSYANGERDLIEISDRINVSLSRLIPIVKRLVAGGVLEEKRISAIKQRLH